MINIALGVTDDGTLFDSRKIPLSEWVEFLLHLFEFHSVKTSARDNRNAESTGKYWLAKVFSALEGAKTGWLSRAGYGSTRPSSRSAPATGSRRAAVGLGTTTTRWAHQRRPRQAEEVPEVARRVRKAGPARLAEPFWLIWGEPRNRYEKASRLIKMAISANKVIRYRDLYGKKD